MSARGTRARGLDVRERWTRDVWRAGGNARRQRRCVPWERAIGAPRGGNRARARARSSCLARARARTLLQSHARASHTRPFTRRSLLPSHPSCLSDAPARTRAVRPHRARPRARPVRRADHQAGAFARGPPSTPPRTRGDLPKRLALTRAATHRPASSLSHIAHRIAQASRRSASAAADRPVVDDASRKYVSTKRPNAHPPRCKRMARLASPSTATTTATRARSVRHVRGRHVRRR